jgi:hypothetical protein
MPSGSRGRSVDGHGGYGLGAHPPRLSLCSHALYLGRRWYEDENYSHGFLTPLVSAYLVWERRGQLRSLTPRSSLGGLLIVIGGLGGNATHRSVTDPDCRFVSKGTSGTGAFPGYTVNALMENRHQILVGFGPEIFRSVASETAGGLALLQRAQAGWVSRPPPSAGTRASSPSASSRRRAGAASSPTSRRTPAAIKPRMRASRCACGALGTSCPNGPGRRSKSCSRRARTGMGFAGSVGAGCSAFDRRRPDGWVLNLKCLATLLGPQLQPT